MSCNHPITPLFTLGDVGICAGSMAEAESQIYTKGTLPKAFISLASSKDLSYSAVGYQQGASNTLPGEFAQYLYPHQPCPIVSIPCVDGSYPHLPLDFWDRLHGWIMSLDEGTVFVHCHGGHGRTGLALAMLVGLSGHTEEDPIRYVRKHYCDQAVETSDQIWYLETLLNYTTQEQPARAYSSAQVISSQPSYAGYASFTPPWNETTPDVDTPKDSAMSIYHDLMEDARGYYKNVLNGDPTAITLWDDKDPWYDQTQACYYTAWGGYAGATKATAKKLIKLVKTKVEQELGLPDKGGV